MVVSIFRKGWVTLSSNFRWKGLRPPRASPTNHCWCQYSRVIAVFVWYQNFCSALFGFVTKHVCDGRTDEQNYDSKYRASLAGGVVKKCRVICDQGRWLWWYHSIDIRSFHRRPHEPNGCVMSTDLPWMSEPSADPYVTNDSLLGDFLGHKTKQTLYEFCARKQYKLQVTVYVINVHISWMICYGKQTHCSTDCNVWKNVFLSVC